RSKVISSYMRLLRTERKVFDSDFQTLNRVQLQTRSQYRDNRSVDDPVKIDEMVQHANAVSDFLLTNTIQAVRKTETRFELKLRKDTQLGMDRQYEFVGDQPKKRERGTRKGVVATECCGGGACGPMSVDSPKTGGCS
ncbi:hypothetical protein SAMD00019534_090960, partial [Acytostelium subglobosum LB1]|uniref:hypothetical protein n=1 Tax=Acytostelium subglobosum LB1 TaxID=1410327 RepID=UPI0006450D58